MSSQRFFPANFALTAFQLVDLSIQRTLISAGHSEEALEKAASDMSETLAELFKSGDELWMCLAESIRDALAASNEIRIPECLNKPDLLIPFSDASDIKKFYLSLTSGDRKTFKRVADAHLELEDYVNSEMKPGQSKDIRSSNYSAKRDMFEVAFRKSFCQRFKRGLWYALYLIIAVFVYQAIRALL